MTKARITQDCPVNEKCMAGIRISFNQNTPYEQPTKENVECQYALGVENGRMICEIPGLKKGHPAGVRYCPAFDMMANLSHSFSIADAQGRWYRQ